MQDSNPIARIYKDKWYWINIPRSNVPRRAFSGVCADYQIGRRWTVARRIYLGLQCEIRIRALPNRPSLQPTVSHWESLSSRLPEGCCSSNYHFPGCDLILFGPLPMCFIFGRYYKPLSQNEVFNPQAHFKCCHVPLRQHLYSQKVYVTWHTEIPQSERSGIWIGGQEFIHRYLSS